MERQRWSEAAAFEPHPGKVKYNEAIIYFARASGMAQSGTTADARVPIDSLQSLSTALHEAKQTYWAEQIKSQHRVAGDLAGAHERHVSILLHCTGDATEPSKATNEPCAALRQVAVCGCKRV